MLSVSEPDVSPYASTTSCSPSGGGITEPISQPTNGNTSGFGSHTTGGGTSESAVQSPSPPPVTTSYRDGRSSGCGSMEPPVSRLLLTGSPYKQLIS